MSAAPKGTSRLEVLEALGRYQKRGAIDISYEHILDTLIDESDRGVTVIVGSLLEDLLLMRLQKSFGPPAAAQEKNLVRAGGLISTFDDWITFAHALGLIDQKSGRTLAGHQSDAQRLCAQQTEYRFPHP